MERKIPTLIDQKKVLKILGISRSNLSRRRKDGEFPKSVPGLPLRWRQDDIIEYLETA